MARDATGRQVQRAGSTGGGRTYRSQTSTNWFAIVIVIVILGLASVVFARYEYQNPAAATASGSAIPPKVGQVWFSGFEFSLCGTAQPPPPANANASTVGLTTGGDGVIQIAPKTASEAGVHATLGRFVADYPGMTLTESSVGYPGQSVLKNGQACAPGTPDAGQKGVVQVEYWPTFVAKTGTKVAGNPGSLKLGQNSLVTIGFAPAGTTLAKPSGTIVTALIKAGEQGPTTAPTVPATTGTTAPTPTTTAPSPTTTAPSTTTTTGKK
jgi:hypothetical protein